MSDNEMLVCVGGPMDGQRAHAAEGARYVEFAGTVPMPDDGMLYTTQEQSEMTYRSVVYEPLQIAVSATRLFRILVPVGTKPAEAMENLIAGYRSGS